MTITLEQMYAMQKELDSRIIREKGLEGQDLLPNTVLALQVEIAELANEWRGFKHWSNDREPRTVVQVTCPTCKGKGEVPDLADGMGYTFCPDCGRNGQVIVNKLLEEYIDCLHFFLSIARQLGIQNIPDFRKRSKDTTAVALSVVDQFIDLMKMVGKIRDRDVGAWEVALWRFFDLGVNLGFSWNQIAAAYVTKNKVNHQRQANGY